MARIRFQGWMPFDLRLIAVAAVATSALCTCATRTAAEGFRIETQIFVGDEEDPASTSTTLYLDGVFYDFLSEPQQVAMFRKPGGGKPGRFILLDPERRVRTELTTDQLTGAMEKLRTWASRQKDPFLKFAANPEFDESFDKVSGKLVLASHEESYTVESAPAADIDSIAEYREYLNWYTKLNALIHSGPPPGPRLEVNAAMARHKIVPTKVELTHDGDKKPLRAEHAFTWRLSKSDFERIDDANMSLAAYRDVPNEEFVRGLPDSKSSH